MSALALIFHLALAPPQDSNTSRTPDASSAPDDDGHDVTDGDAANPKRHPQPTNPYETTTPGAQDAEGDETPTTVASPLSTCLMQEGFAVMGCCGGITLLGLGVLTLGITPVFANAPLPIGIVGVAFGAIAILGSTVTALTAPLQLFRDPEPEPEPAVPDASTTKTSLAH